ncbi:TPA: hypothetical protein U5D50_004258 [Yersinia enterocolitica]|nr:hypothetical protein [Yersinia enterocolitica]
MNNVFDINHKKRAEEEKGNSPSSIPRKIGQHLLSAAVYSARLVFFWCLNLTAMLFVFITLFSRIFVFLIFIVCILSMLILHYTHHQTGLKFSIQLFTPFVTAFVVHLIGKLTVFIMAFRDSYRLKYGF